jgi:hypothetical protein
VKNRKLFDSNRLKRLLKKEGAAGNKAVRILCNPEFPLYYTLRNLAWLKRERWWTDLSACGKRLHVLRIVSERISIFNEVKKWRENLEKVQIPSPDFGDTDAEMYCNKCGLCCEVASGMPDFPAPGALPTGWREIFGNGLGQGHRFCSFLWEDNGSGGGFCAIYPLRSNPCRLFGLEECDFFWNSIEPAEISSPRKILSIGRWLIKLVNASASRQVGRLSMGRTAGLQHRLRPHLQWKTPSSSDVYPNYPRDFILSSK